MSSPSRVVALTQQDDVYPKDADTVGNANDISPIVVAGRDSSTMLRVYSDQLSKRAQAKQKLVEYCQNRATALTVEQ